MEALSVVESRRAKKDISALKSKVTEILDAVPKNKKVPEWDDVPIEHTADNSNLLS